MRIRAHPLAWLLLGTSLGAQTPLNLDEMYPDATTATSRSGLAPATAGDVLLQYDRTNVLGTGQGITGLPSGRINGFRAVLQDQDAATPEQFSLVVVEDDPLNPGNPNPSATGELLRTGPIPTPTGTGPTAFVFTFTLSTPADIAPATSTWYFGVGLPANPTWPSDGLSGHIATYYAGTAGDNPRAGAPNRTFAITRPGATVVQAATERVAAVGLLTEAPAVGLGADIAPSAQRGPNPAFGIAGMYPDIAGRGDGLALRLRDAGNAGSLTALLMGFAILPTPITIPGVTGQLFLDPTVTFVVSTHLIPPSGELVVAPAFLGQGQIPTGLSLRLGFQFATVTNNGQGIALSSVVTCSQTNT
jgi:hypothetical protein